MRRILRGLLVVVAILVLLAGALYALSESREVVVLHARDAAGDVRATHLWIIDDGGTAWLRSGGPERGWFMRVKAAPQIDLERGAETRAYTAVIVEAPETVARVNQLMREKYGWIDALIERIEGGWEPIALRLDPR